MELVKNEFKNVFVAVSVNDGQQLYISKSKPTEQYLLYLDGVILVGT